MDAYREHARKPPQRRYPFWARRDRRRTAMAIANGCSNEEAALIDRVPILEIERLRHDPEFAAMLRHYQAITRLSYEQRLARLASIALQILDMALETGDLRAVAFVLHEEDQGDESPTPAVDEPQATTAAPLPIDSSTEPLAATTAAAVRRVNRDVLRRLHARLVEQAAAFIPANALADPARRQGGLASWTVGRPPAPKGTGPPG